MFQKTNCDKSFVFKVSCSYPLCSLSPAAGSLMKPFKKMQGVVLDMLKIKWEELFQIIFKENEGSFKELYSNFFCNHTLCSFHQQQGLRWNLISSLTFKPSTAPQRLRWLVKLASFGWNQKKLGAGLMKNTYILCNKELLSGFYLPLILPPCLSAEQNTICRYPLS